MSKLVTASPSSVRFETTLSAFANNTGVVVRDDVVAKLGAGKRPPVVVAVNCYEYPNTIAVMGGQNLISVSAAFRRETGLRGGDPFAVVLTVADGPRYVDVPETRQRRVERQWRSSSLESNDRPAT